MSLIHFSCKCNYSILLHNKTPIYSTWGLLSVCAACPTPSLNQSYELRPTWEQHLRYVPHRVRNGYNTVAQYIFPVPPAKRRRRPLPSKSTLIHHPVPFSSIYSLWTAAPHKEPGKFLILSESPSQKLTVSGVDKLLGAFANQLPKATTSFVMRVHLSFSPHESARISPDEFP